MTALVTVQFHNQPIVAIEKEGKHFVAMRQIAENIGLDWKAQYARITRHAILKTSVVIMTTVADDDRDRAMVCLPLDMLNGWLFGVDVNRVKPAIKEKLMQYQRECFSVLNAHFNKRQQPVQQSLPQLDQITPSVYAPIPNKVIERAADMAGQVFAAAVKSAAFQKGHIDRFLVTSDFVNGKAEMQMIERDAYVMPMRKLLYLIRSGSPEVSVTDTLSLMNACAHGIAVHHSYMQKR